MYTKAAAWTTGANPLPMWDAEGSGMVPNQIWQLISVTVGDKVMDVLMDLERIHRGCGRPLLKDVFPSWS